MLHDIHRIPFKKKYFCIIFFFLTSPATLLLWCRSDQPCTKVGPPEASSAAQQMVAMLIFLSPFFHVFLAAFWSPVALPLACDWCFFRPVSTCMSALHAGLLRALFPRLPPTSIEHLILRSCLCFSTSGYCSLPLVFPFRLFLLSLPPSFFVFFKFISLPSLPFRNSRRRSERHLDVSSYVGLEKPSPKRTPLC